MTAKKFVRRKAGQAASLDRIEGDLKELAKRMERALAPLRREIAKAEKRAGANAARLLRRARVALNKVEIGSRSDWHRFLRQSRSDLAKALGQLERSVQPKRTKAARKRVRG